MPGEIAVVVGLLHTSRALLAGEQNLANNWEIKMADAGWGVLQTVIGGAISLVSTVGVTWWTKKNERTAAAEQLAKAFKGEIAAIISIVELRQYIPHIRAAAAHVQASGEPLVFRVNIREEYRTVYKANASKLGSLPGDLPVQIPVIYTQIGSVLEDLATLVGYSAPGTYRPEADELHGMYVILADLMDDTLEKGRAVIAEIEKRYPQTD